MNWKDTAEGSFVNVIDLQENNRDEMVTERSITGIFLGNFSWVFEHALDSKIPDTFHSCLPLTEEFIKEYINKFSSCSPIIQQNIDTFNTSEKIDNLKSCVLFYNS